MDNLEAINEKIKWIEERVDGIGIDLKLGFNRLVDMLFLQFLVTLSLVGLTIILFLIFR
jgi:hypothetical protein